MSISRDWRRHDAGREFAALLLAVCAIAAPAAAQIAPTLDEGNLVLTRPRPGYDAEGIALGGFRAFPRIEASAAYDDNIYATDDVRVSSPILLLSPQIRILSQWSRHALALDANGAIERYTGRRSENNERYRVTAAGRVDLRDVATINLQARHLKSIETRGTAGDIFLAGEPIRFRTTGATAGVILSLASISASLTGDFDRTSYWDARVGGIDLSQAYRDRRSYSGDFQLSYTWSPALRPFIELKHEQQRYDLRTRALSFDSTGTIAMAGVKVALTQLLTGRVALGYRWRNYRNPAYASTKGLSYDLALVWNPRTLLSVTLGARKSIEESPNPIASGIVSSGGSAAVDYELLRNVLIGVSTAYVDERYRGIDRTDRRFTGVVGARYLLNRFVQLGARYTRITQNGLGVLSRTYRDNTVGLALTLQR